MADIFNEKINKYTNWGGDDSTGGKPVSGERVQEFIKESLDSKVGYFYYDSADNRYLVFADSDTKDKYLETLDTSLILGNFSAPFNYTAEINVSTDSYNTIFLGSTGNIINFSFDIKNKQGASTGENVLITYTIVKGTKRVELRETKSFGSHVSFNVDKYLEEGTNNVMINVMGQTTLAATTVAITYEVVNLSLIDHLDISKVYDLSNNTVDYLEVSYDVSGSYTKLLEWYIDGVQLEFNHTDDEILETVPVSRTKTIELSNLSHGRHNLQFRVGTRVNGEIFYSNILYRDFFVYTGLDDHIMIGLAVTLPSSNGIIESNSPLIIPNMVQYVGYDLKIASYSPLNIAKTEISITLDQETIGTISSSNGKVTDFSVVPINAGNKELKLIAHEVELESQVEYSIPVVVEETSMSLTEITSGLSLNFSAGGYNNNSTNRDKWVQGDIIGTLTGFKWNNTSGWVNNRLEIDTDSEIHFNYSPLNNHSNGKTIEIEWMSKNVSNEDAVLCDLTNDEGTGIIITASSIIAISKGKTELIEKYKSEENIRVGIVINPSDRGTNKGLTFIYTNGVVSRSVNILKGDDYVSNKELSFKGTAEASISLKSIRVYDEALTSDQLLNNYNLYRDTVSEMYEIYERNDIYDNNKISPTKLVGRLPVMIITGDIPALENTNDKDTQIVVDIEYINMQDPSRSFKMKDAAMRPQGTSSMGYPKKNFRIYTQKLDNTVLEVNGSVVKDKLYSFKEGAVPVNCWCLKADYAESSGTHNTGIAKLWGNAFKNARVTCDLGKDNPHSVQETTVLRTKAQQCAIDNEYPYDIRTTIDGFPILVFYRRTETDDVIFIGKYNFNNDKSTELVFGFKDVPGFDNSRMQCWEFLNNGNSIGLFTDITDFYNDVVSDGKTKKGWELAFEARYPDKSTDTTDLYNFASWINGINGDHARFTEEKWDHLDVYKVAGYYCYLNRHGAADQFVKNAMLTSEDGEHFFYILYDNDTINGLNNTGAIAILPTDNRESTYEDGSHKFAGYDSVLWNMLEADDEFMVVIRAVDNALTKSDITYGNVINIFDNEQSGKWVERIYNLDSEYKYITPYTQNGINNLFMLQGKRELHRRWWLSNRFSLYDSLFVSGAYKSGYVEIKCIDETQPVQEFKVTSGYPLYFGYGINGNLRQRTENPLQPNQTHTFQITEKVNLGDPIAIYGAPHIKELDLSLMSDRLAVLQLAGVYDKDLGTKLEKLTIGSSVKTNVRLQEVSGIKNATALKYLDITNLSGLTSIDLSNNFYLQELYASGTNISSMVLAEGAPINHLVLPATFKNIDFKSLPALNFDGIVHNFNIIESIKISDCSNLSNDFNWVYDWYTNKIVSNDKAVLHMDNIMWENVNYQHLINLANIGDLQLKGKVVISEGSQEIIDTLKAVFGDTVFNKTSEFYIQAPDGIYLSGPSTLLEGESARYVAAVFSEAEGRVQFAIVEGRTGCSIDPVSGILATIENGQSTSEIVIRAVFIPKGGGSVVQVTKSVTIEQRSYPSSATIDGSATIDADEVEYSLSVKPADVTGNYKVIWSLSENVSEYLTIKSFTNSGCVLTRTKEGLLNFTLTAQIVKVVNDAVIKTISRTLSLVLEGVIITSASNAALQRALYNAGLVENESYSYDWEVALITGEQLLNSSGNSIFRSAGVASLDEFKYFTGVVELPSRVFPALRVLSLPTSIKKATSPCEYYPEVVNVTSLEHLLSIETEHGFADSGTTIYVAGEPLIDLVIPETVSETNYVFYRYSKLKSATINHSLKVNETLFWDCSNLELLRIDSSGTLELLQPLVSGNTGRNVYFKGELNCSFIKKTGNYSCDLFGKYLQELVVGNREFNISNVYIRNTSSTQSNIVRITDLAAYCRSYSNNFGVADRYSSIYVGDTLVTEDYTLNVPEGITAVNPYTFYFWGCNVVLSSSVTQLCTASFYGFLGEKIYINSDVTKKSVSVTSSNADVFTSCAAELIFGDSVTTITNLASLYDKNNIKKITIGANVSTVSLLAYFPSLAELSVSQDNPVFSDKGGNVLFEKESCRLRWVSSTNTTIPEDTKIIGQNCFYKYTTTQEVVIPPSVETIEYNAFYASASLTKLKIIVNNHIVLSSSWMDSSTTISESFTIEGGGTVDLNGRLYLKKTPEVTLDCSFKYLCQGAFFDCATVSNVRFSSDFSGTALPLYVFKNSGIEEIDIPSSVSSIGSEAFYGCLALKKITVRRATAPSVGGAGHFGSNETSYTGRNTYNTGENILYVPQGATGYDTGYWLDPLQNAEKCGFTISYTL